MEPGNHSSPKARSTIDRFFRGLCECIFHSKMGVVDVQMVDYISDMMLRFVRSDALGRVRHRDGRPVTEVFQMLHEAEGRIGLARRGVHRHIGDFTLFWSGMYPESLRKIQGQSTGDHFLDYCQQGKRAYAIAASIQGGKDRPSCEVLHRMSEQFDMCAYGLREIRREWEGGTGSNNGLIS